MVLGYIPISRDPSFEVKKAKKQKSKKVAKGSDKKGFKGSDAPSYCRHHTFDESVEAFSK